MKFLRPLTLVILLLIFGGEQSSAQCSMCRAVAESGARDDSQRVGRGLNTGILYLLATPYLIGGVAFFIWRKHRRKKNAVQANTIIEH